MKFHLTQAAGFQLITAYGDGWVEVNHSRHERSLIVLPGTLITDWQASEFDLLDVESLRPILELKPEVVLLGTGSRHRFLHPAKSRELTEAGISLESMTTEAACRTYNILMAEGRQVAAALLI
ncbi:MAG: Mth938-like domain-containing protein [Methylobacillus glycogenes]|nr:Mth938-like domain-containing protein [Methylobacillus glycogenes]